MKQQQRKQNDNFYFSDNFNDLYESIHPHHHSNASHIKDNTKSLDVMNDESISINKKKRMLKQHGTDYETELNNVSRRNQKSNKNKYGKTGNKLKKHKKR